MRVVNSQRWKIFMIACCLTYAVFIYLPSLPSHPERAERPKFPSKAKISDYEIPEELLNPIHRVKPEKVEESFKKPADYFEFKPVEGSPFYVEEVLTNYRISLKEKLTCKADRTASPRVIVSVNAGHGQENLGGCPEWNCELTKDKSRIGEADALIFSSLDFSVQRKSDQYAIFFSQESPKNTGYQGSAGDFFNMSIGFRHDSPTASPYGYTVKLAPQSRRVGELIDKERVQNKSKGAAWFVSHCSTNSQREAIVSELQKFISVDIYGSCGTLHCSRGGSCENALDTEYHFYITFENSICKDYLTEKLWNQGYGRDLIPIVLKRSIAEPFVPPNSFIAVDDFRNVEELGNHLNYLMSNKTAYMEYFNWRRDYKVIFLNGKNHDILEKPWGFCQICRLLWENPKKHYSISDFSSYWTNSCEHDGTLAGQVIKQTN